MYKCFAGIPQEVRQQAFDVYATAAKRDGQGVDLARVTLEPDNDDGETGWLRRMDTVYRCCPWGAINYVLLKQHPELAEKAAASRGKLRLPRDGEEEHDLLQLLGLDTDSDSANRFIHANDNWCFKTLSRLAKAMGAKYTEAE